MGRMGYMDIGSSRARGNCMDMVGEAEMTVEVIIRYVVLPFVVGIVIGLVIHRLSNRR